MASGKTRLGSPGRRRAGPVTWPGLLRAAAVATLLLSLVTIVDTGLHAVELFAHFRLQYFVAALVLLPLFAVQRAPLYALMMLGTAAVNGGYLLPWYEAAQAAEPGTPLKLLYANVSSKNEDYAALVALVESEQPDMVFLMEFSPGWQAAAENLRSSYPVSYLQPRGNKHGMAMFSRLPLAAVRHADSPPRGYPTIVARAVVNGAPVTLIGTHASIPVGGDNFAARNEQLRSVAGLVRESDGPIVVLGDLNASLWDRHYRAFEAATGLRNARLGFGVMPTWPTFLPFAMIPIDHVLVSTDLRVVELRRGPRIGSDHLPLIVTVAGDF